ncbi:MAG: NAD(P)H-hydrate dehydratase [Clostridium sp.]|uniref:NAD(P)H-hydrate dehydratase n=1 Tax=Clostridium sp. TaxID=1506 RepID=UPI0025C48E6C|nr:NAD(P)H-hydrate dehydratase [Clostridium sp.]MCH3965869.1 NAD(P)H-hydrate dehydratase [Clostridium sp.]MCI1716042.1 NAD(P)H-hydrate dehydratase [Clostridium sp.]MCI1800286.1 NAD(P)H-hydrate dehydratase [Clostridium sp.]MCI1814219.1 NAD(P)H-hydrate dehydratase [Clostridium sp.]MCI1871118.1 NAD(P)H-hydrate dehydratase [Clostridium sp.]
MKIASVEIMRNIDSYCIDELKIPGIILMENAALKVIKNIDMKNFNSFCVFCTKGNNGGDGFAVARHLYNSGKSINVFLIGNENNMSHDCKVNYDILKKLGIKINKINDYTQIESLERYIKFSDMIIDAVFGTGLSRDVEGIYAEVIKSINDNSKYTLSIDIPSGLNGNTGSVLKNCIRADKTVSFQMYKSGFFKYGADKFIGELIVEDIGIPDSAIEKFDIGEFIVDNCYIRGVLKKRNKYSHKGDFGRVLVVAGSDGFSGAAYISTQSAVKSGAGLVTLACRENIQKIMSQKLTEAMTFKLEEEKKLENFIERSASIGIGPGMGNNKVTLDILKKVVNKASNTVVIDADGINVLRDNLDILKNRNCNIIMTPHPGEMSRITGLDIDYIEDNRIEVAKKFARDYNVILVLKGYNTVITDGYTTALNSTGNSSMASGGMGDCLTGIIASFAAQKYKAFEAACISVYIHGICGDRLSKNMFCVSASDIINEIPYAIKDILCNTN